MKLHAVFLASSALALPTSKSRPSALLEGQAVCDVGGVPAVAVPPADSFDMSVWKLQTDLPRCDGRSYGVREIFPEELDEYVSSGFYVNSTDAMLVFVTNVTGATTSTNAPYPRQELRELTQWPLSSGRHVMTTRMAVTHLPAEGQSTVIGQIKPRVSDHKLPLIKMRAKVYGSTRPGFRLDARVKANKPGGADPLNPDEISLKFTKIGQKGRIDLGEFFDFTIVVENMVLSITVALNGESQTVRYDYTGIHPFDRADKDTDIYYFKVGNYLQSNAGKFDSESAAQGENGVVKLTGLSLTHEPPLSSSNVALLGRDGTEDKDEDGDDLIQDDEEE